MKHKIIIAGIFVTGSQALSAADRAMPDEAKAMLKNAVAHYQSVGRKQALADFSAKKPPFADRELYLVCIGPGHLISAHGAFPQYVAPGRLSERRRGQTAWGGHRGRIQTTVLSRMNSPIPKVPSANPSLTGGLLPTGAPFSFVR